jgi:hypothetical protein
MKSMKTSSSRGKTRLIEILCDRDASAVDELLVAGSDEDAYVRKAHYTNWN